MACGSRALMTVLCFSALTAAAGLDSLNMQTLSQYPDGTGMASATATINARKYLVTGSGLGIAVFDISVANAPARVGGLALMGMPSRIVVSGAIAYVTTYNYGLVIVDLATPAAPVLRSKLAMANVPEALAVNGAYAYVGDENKTVTAISVADPAHPAVDSSVTIGGYRATGIAISGSYAFVSNDDTGFVVLDLSAPAAPVRRASCVMPKGAYDIAVAGHFAYVACLDSGLVIVNISDPLHPVRNGTWVPAPGSYVQYATVVGTTAYLHLNNTFFTVDVADSMHPATSGQIANNVDGDGAVSVSDTVAYFQNPYGVGVVNVKNPASPVAQPYVPMDYMVQYLSVAANRLYLSYMGGSAGGLRIVDIQNPLATGLLCTYDSASSYSGWVASANGDTLFAIRNNGRLTILNAHNPAAIAVIADYAIGPSNVSPGGITRLGSRLYLATPDSGLIILDITNPAAPARLGAFKTAGIAKRVCLSASGNLAYVACNDSGMSIVDVRDPATPTLAGRYQSSQAGALVTDVAVAGTRAYLASGYTGKLEIINVADSAHPAYLGHFTGAMPTGVAAKGDTVYLVGGYMGVQVISASNPASPVEIGHYRDAGWRYGSPVWFTNCIALGANGLLVDGEYTAGIRLLHFGTQIVATAPGRLKPATARGRSAGPALVTVYELNGRIVYRGMSDASFLTARLASRQLLRGTPLVVEVKSANATTRSLVCLPNAGMGRP